MNTPIRIANCSGFYGDRVSAAREMVDGGPIDALTGDWLAELTMLILSRTRQRRPGGGYARTFVTQMEQVLGTCLDRGIKVVSNAGGLDPDGCADAVAEVADRLGVSPTIAYVNGDDLMDRLDELVADKSLLAFESGEPITGANAEQFLTANAYLGCWGIVDALSQGADIVITGRVTDAAVVCGPAAWHHGWARDDWDALAGAVAAGHVIECGAQATGGNYSFFDEIPSMSVPSPDDPLSPPPYQRAGFPWAEIAADGSSVIGKHDDTGGEVSIGTVTSQLLYEIAGPQYYGPDVVTRFDTIELDRTGSDRVRLSGIRGEPPPSTLKVATNELGGYRNQVTIAVTGLDIDAKAALLDAAFWDACPYRPDDFASVSRQLIRSDHPDPATNEEAVALWRLTVKDPDERKVGRAFSNAGTELGLSSTPGFFGVGGGPAAASSYGVYRPALVPAELVPQHVVVRSGDSTERTVVDSVAPAAALGTVVIDPLPGPSVAEPASGDTTDVPLGTVVGTRSGDKGGDANLGVFARPSANRRDDIWAWLDGYLTVDRVRALLPEAADLTIDRYRLPALRSLNFVIHGLLQEGVAASTRQDAQAKSLGEWLRARVVPVPNTLLT